MSTSLAQTVTQAVQAASTLAPLLQRLQQSRHMLDCVQDLIPGPLRPLVQAGPLDERGWCLLVPHSAASAKMRQIRPLMMQELQDRGMEVSGIRIRVQRDN